MSALAELWPLLLVAGCAGFVFAAARLGRRFSPGALSAGPRLPPDPTNLGHSELADDLRRIDRRLDTRPVSLIRRLEHSCHELGVAVADVTSPDGRVPNPEAHIEILLRRLEAQLELGSMPATDPTHDQRTTPA